MIYMLSIAMIVTVLATTAIYLQDRNERSRVKAKANPQRSLR